MKTYDLTELALRNLRESSLRNSLTTIGISVGVASLVAMLSLGSVAEVGYAAPGKLRPFRHRGSNVTKRLARLWTRR